MTKQQARRIALAIEASYILFGAETGCIYELLSEKEYEKFKVAQEELAYSMLKKAGFTEALNADDIVRIVMGENWEPQKGSI